MDDVEIAIARINQLDDPSKRKLPLPGDALIEKYEKQLGLIFSQQYKRFLKTVSNAFIGYLSPLTLNVEMGGVYGELYSTIVQARALGLPHDWLPLCEDNGDYYCIIPDGSVRFWSNDGSTEDSWPNLVAWINEVWVEGK